MVQYLEGDRFGLWITQQQRIELERIVNPLDSAQSSLVRAIEDRGEADPRINPQEAIVKAYSFRYTREVLNRLLTNQYDVGVPLLMDICDSKAQICHCYVAHIQPQGEGEQYPEDKTDMRPNYQIITTFDHDSLGRLQVTIFPDYAHIGIRFATQTAKSLQYAEILQRFPAISSRLAVRLTRFVVNPLYWDESVIFDPIPKENAWSSV